MGGLARIRLFRKGMQRAYTGGGGMDARGRSYRTRLAFLQENRESFLLTDRSGAEKGGKKKGHGKHPHFCEKKKVLVLEGGIGKGKGQRPSETGLSSKRIRKI